jgi:hypothetical protein
MANQKIFEVLSGRGSQVYIEYNDVNLRVGGAFFTIPAGITAAVKIWVDAGITAAVKIWVEGQLVLDTTYQPGSYEENVPGNYRVVEEIDADDGSAYALLPSEIAWSYSELPS